MWPRRDGDLGDGIWLLLNVVGTVLWAHWWPRGVVGFMVVLVYIEHLGNGGRGFISPCSRLRTERRLAFRRGGDDTPLHKEIISHELMLTSSVALDKFCYEPITDFEKIETPTIEIDGLWY